MRRVSIVVLVALSLAIPVRSAVAQRAVSFGVAAGLPLASPDGPHGMVTLEVGPRRFPVRFRSELSVTESRDRGRVYQAAGSLLVPFLDRPLSPYLVGGIALGINQWAGGPQSGGEGVRAGLGLRYRVGERVLFAENAYHWGFRRSQLAFGVQF
jgi:hypothetical protein